MIPQHQKTKIVSDIPSENLLRTDLIIPLFRKMGFLQVLDNQSQDERGIDVVLEQKNELGKSQFTALVLKNDEITAKVGHKSSVIRILQEQILQAFHTEISHPDVPRSSYSERVWVITNKKITRSAKDNLSKFCKEQSSKYAGFEALGTDDLVSLLDEYWPEYYEDQRPFLSQYGRKLTEELYGLDLSVLGYNGNTKNLDDIFIDPLLQTIQDPEVIGQLEFDLTNDKKPISCEQFLKTDDEFAFIFGVAGSGKSTILKRLAAKKSEEGKEVPILFHAKEFIQKPATIETLFNNALKKYSDSSTDNPYEQIGANNTLMLIDGLDEISNKDDRISAIKNLEDIIKSDSSDTLRVVICTRPDSHQKLLKIYSQYPCYEILPLQIRQIELFFKKWFIGDSRSNKLYYALTDKGILEKLPKTPLTLTLLAVVYETKEDIPSTITQLYQMFSELLLGKWDSIKSMSDISNVQIKINFLEELAWDMHKSGNEDISQDRVLYLATDYINERLGKEAEEPNDFIQSIISRSGLLTLTDRGDVKFQHLSFQEFFCAQYILKHEILKPNIEQWFGDEWWANVLYFSAGLKNSIDDIIDDLVESDFDNEENRFSKILALGGMLQSAFGTRNSNKQKAIVHASLNMPISCEEMINHLSNEGSNVPRFAVLGAMQHYFSLNYSSLFLKQALKDARNKLKNEDERNILSEFLISSALCNSGDSNELEDLATEPTFIDPSLMLLSDFILSEYETKHDIKKLSSPHKKIKKRISENVKSIRDDFLLPMSKRKKLLTSSIWLQKKTSQS